MKVKPLRDRLLVRRIEDKVEKKGSIVRRALEEPLRRIVNNAGLEGSVVVNQVKELELDKGFDAQSETFVNMVDAGIIDPTKVARVALRMHGLRSDRIRCRVAVARAARRVQELLSPHETLVDGRQAPR